VRFGRQETPEMTGPLLYNCHAHIYRFGPIVSIILSCDEIHEFRIVLDVALHHLAELVESDVLNTEDHHSIVGKIGRDHFYNFFQGGKGHGTFRQEDEMQFFIFGQAAGDLQGRHYPGVLFPFIHDLEKPAFEAKPVWYLGDEGVHTSPGGKIQIHCMFNDPHHGSGIEDFGEDVPGAVGYIHAVNFLPVGPDNF
jgi:hypothetical protein